MLMRRHMSPCQHNLPFAWAFVIISVELITVLLVRILLDKWTIKISKMRRSNYKEGPVALTVFDHEGWTSGQWSVVIFEYMCERGKKRVRWGQRPRPASQAHNSLIHLSKWKTCTHLRLKIFPPQPAMLTCSSTKRPMSPSLSAFYGRFMLWIC